MQAKHDQTAETGEASGRKFGVLPGRSSVHDLVAGPYFAIFIVIQRYFCVRRAAPLLLLMAMLATPAFGQVERPRDRNWANSIELSFFYGTPLPPELAMEEIVAETDEFHRQSDLGAIASHLYKLEQMGELARASNFARFVYESLANTPVGESRAFLPIVNAHAKYCSIQSDLDCLETASAKAIKVLGGIPEDRSMEERKALEWRAIALILGGDLDGATRYLTPSSLAVEPGANHEIASQIDSMVISRTDFSNEFAIRMRRAALDFLDPASRREHPWILDQIQTGLGADYLIAGQYGDAEAVYRDIYERALASYPADSIAVTTASRNLATALVLRGRSDLALPLFERNWRIARDVGDWSIEYSSEVSDWITALIDRGRIAQAVEDSRSVWEAAEQDDTIDPKVLGQYGLSYGTALTAAGLYAKAEEVLRRSQALVGGLLRWGGPGIARALAKALEEQGKWAEAEPSRREGEDYAQRDLLEGEFSEARISAGLALANNLSMQRKSEAERLFRAMLKLARDRKDPSRRIEAEASLGLAMHLLPRGGTEEAITLSRSALDIRTRQLDRLSAGADSNAVLAAAAGQNRAARLVLQAYLSEPTRSQEDLEAMFLAAQRADASAASLALSTQAAANVARLAGAAVEIERWQKAQTRLADLDAHLLYLEGLGEGDTVQKSAAYQARQSALEQFRAIEAELQARFPRFFDLARPSPATLSDLRATLGEEEAVLLLVPSEPSSLLWRSGGTVIAVTRTGLAAAPIERTREELSTLLESLHEGLAAPGSGYTSHPDFDLPEVIYSREAAFELYRSLFGADAIADVIASSKSWTIVPQGDFVSVAFEALVTEQPVGGQEGDTDPDTLRATKWLGVERAIAIAPSVQSITLARGAAAETEANVRAPFLGVGDPAFSGREDPPVQVPDDLRERALLAAVRAPETASAYFRGNVADLEELSQLSRLPGTAFEIQALAEILGAPASDVLTQLNATEARIAALNAQGRLSETEIVVFATHGLIAGELKGGLSEPALALTPPRNVAQDALQPANDGLLTASEAAALRLTADWLILSACNTAAGSGRNGQGLSGMARAFLYAGAKALLVSHFPVSDRATPALTSTAVNIYRKQKRSQAEAMREARVRMLASTVDDDKGVSLAHPKAWAALTLVAPGR